MITFQERSVGTWYRATVEWITDVGEADLPLRRNDLIFVTDSVDANWWKGTNKKGKRGYVPASYLELALQGTVENKSPRKQSGLPHIFYLFR
jgi:hypothetical protein